MTGFDPTAVHTAFSTKGVVHENPAVSLNRRSWAALALIAGMIIFDQVLLQPALSHLTSDAPVINVAGRQRMLSQKLTKAALALESATDLQIEQARRAELQEVLHEWRTAHEGLQRGNAELRLPGDNTSETVANFADLEPHFQAMATAVENLLSARGRSSESPEAAAIRSAAVAQILNHENLFLNRMHAIVGAYEDEARRHIAHLKSLEFSLMIAILAVLLVIQFAVVRPAIQGVGREFAQSESQYQRLVESMSDGLLVHDNQGRVQFANRRFCEMVGYTLAELTGAPAALYVADGSRTRYDELCRRAVDENYSTEIALRHRDGRLLETIASPQSLLDSAGEQSGFLLVLTDVTARRQAEQRSRELAVQLSHADRLKSMGELAAEMAHEINQPLGAIANYAEGCLATLGNEAAMNASVIPHIREPLQRILQAALRGGEIVRRARSFSRPQPQDVVAAQINDLVRDIEQLYSAEARKRGIEFRLKLESALPVVSVDSIQIQQVLANLVQNAFVALETTPEFRRRLVIQTRQAGGDAVEITVADTGCGIPSEVRERVFEPFYTTRKEGTGMGLSIVRSIVEAHGGTITAEPNPDGGTILRCQLPSADHALQERATHQIVATAGSLHPTKTRA